MEFCSYFFHLLFLGQIFQLSNTIVSSAKVKISAQNAPTDKLNSLTEQMDEKDVDIGKRMMQQRIKRDTDDDTDDENIPEDEVYIDHRESNCLDDPRSQGGCFASYAFATIAFYEWLYCQKTGTFEDFSEQYVIDCGHRHGNGGCLGGNPAKAMRFLIDCGLASRQFYPYTGRQGDCPHDDSTPYENMGNLRIYEPLKYIPLHQQSLEEHLEYGPIIVIVEVGREFLSYRDGVDDNVGHSPELLHTLLLIGHGREKDKEYWLFRNSQFNPSVGDGHYKLNKNVDCLRGGAGIGLGGHISNENDLS